jgi:DnaJ-class molecular chaperone
MREITIADVTVFRRGVMACVLCGGRGHALLVDEQEKELWKTPRPCPVCRGTGQHSTKSIPSREQIQEMMINYKF